MFFFLHISLSIFGHTVALTSPMCAFLSKSIKVSLYGLEWDEMKKVRDAFYEITEKYVKEFNLDYTIS